MTKTIIGIDPGMTGCIAIYDGTELLLTDMPTHDITKGKSVRKRIDSLRLLYELKETGADHVYIEQVSAQPGNGAAAAFTYGWGCGCIEMAVQAAVLPFTYVTPQKWKKAMGVPADKDGARMIASRLMPQHAHNWALKKHHNRAEASLIALYGFNASPG